MSEKEIEKEVRAIHQAAKKLSRSSKSARVFLNRIGVQSFPMNREELLKLHKKVIDDVRAMTPEEIFKDLIRSGIYTPEGKLTPEYGGPPRKTKKSKTGRS